MIDGCNRTIDYIRISITDRCNLRCIYCMPDKGIRWISHEEILSYDEIARLCKILSELGVKKVKITGGEPLVRKGAATLVKQLKTQCGIEIVTLTTNGMLLLDQIDELAAAGIDSINISLDALDEDKFFSITRRHGMDILLAGIEKAISYKNINVKINCLPMDINDTELLKIAGLAKDSNISVRFIEMMPIGLGKQLECHKEDDVKELLKKEYGKMIPYTKKIGNGPAHYYEIEGFYGKIGFISAITHEFCDDCNRVRMTANGFFKTCLQYEKGVDLKLLIKSGANDSILKNAMESAIFEKPKCHHFYKEEGEQSLEFHNMSQIGG